MVPLGWVAALLLAAAPAPRVDRPLGVDTPGPIDQLLLDQPLRDARAEAPALEVRWGLANSWSAPTTLVRGSRSAFVQLDEQADRLTLALGVPWRRLGAAALAPLATTLEWRVTAHWGGWTDRPIEAWHRVGGYNRFRRPEFPRDAVHVTLLEPGAGRALSLDHAALAPGDAVIRTALVLAEGERLGAPWAAALRLDLKLPLGRPGDLGGSGGADGGAGLAFSAPLLPWLTGHAQLAARRVSQLPGGVPLRLRDWQLGADLSLVAWRGDWAVLAESRLLSPLFERGWQVLGPASQADALTAMTRPRNQLSFGVRRRWLTAWVSEDWTPGARREVGWTWFYDTNAPDLALGFSVVQPL